jgi:hypothetical protein
MAAIAAAIDNALQSAESGQAGLSRRLEEVRLSATMIVGNGDDDYLDREAADRARLNALETDMVAADRRLQQLSTMIGHFKSLKAGLYTRPSDFGRASDDAGGARSCDAVQAGSRPGASPGVLTSHQGQRRIF